MKWIQPNWPAPKHIKALTTVRSSWGEEGLQSNASSLALMKLANLPASPFWMKQTHSTIVLPATEKNVGGIADASFTRVANQVCVVLTADCLPILLCDAAGTTVAAIHAGWRGLAAGIIENTIDALHTAPTNLMAWLGPAIGPDKFEVGADVYDAFVSRDQAAITAFIPLAPGKWLANLYALATLRLNTKGVIAISGGDHCTHSEADLFFSYRRDQGQTGRMASLIWIES